MSLRSAGQDRAESASQHQSRNSSSRKELVPRSFAGTYSFSLTRYCDITAHRLGAARPLCFFRCGSCSAAAAASAHKLKARRQEPLQVQQRHRKGDRRHASAGSQQHHDSNASLSVFLVSLHALQQLLLQHGALLQNRREAKRKPQTANRMLQQEVEKGSPNSHLSGDRRF